MGGAIGCLLALLHLRLRCLLIGALPAVIIKESRVIFEGWQATSLAFAGSTAGATAVGIASYSELQAGSSGSWSVL